MKLIIIGTGITGAFTAYLLALDGLRPIVIGHHQHYPPASFVNPGGLNPLHGPGVPGPLSEFSLSAYQTHLKHWPQIHALSGIDFHPRIVQRLLPAFQAEDLQHLKKMEALYQNTPNFSARWLSPAELLEREPRLSPNLSGGVLTRGNATVMSQHYVQALLTAAQAKGAQWMDADVSGLELTPSKVDVHLATGDSLSAEQVVLATGAWSQLWPGLASSPLIPIKGELLKTSLKGAPLAFDMTYGPHGVYHIEGTNYWFGGSQSQAGFDFSLSEAQAEQISARIAQWLPGCADHWEVVAQNTALRPGTADGFPLLGYLKDQRLIVASGSGPKGMLWSAGLATGVRDLLKEKPLTLAKAFAPLRFEGGSDGKL